MSDLPPGFRRKTSLPPGFRRKDEPLPPSEPQVSAERAALVGAGQGLTFDFGDEIGAGIQAGLQGLSNLVPGEDSASWRDVYRDAVQGNRGEIERAKRQQGTAYTAGDVAGSVVSGMASGAAGGLHKVGQATRGLAGVGQRLGASAVAGAGQGAIRGAGEAEDLGELPASIGRGTLEGAAGGLAGGAVGELLGAGMRGAGVFRDRAMGRVRDQAQRTFEKASAERAYDVAEVAARESRKDVRLMREAREAHREAEELRAVERAGLQGYDEMGVSQGPGFRKAQVKAHNAERNAVRTDPDAPWSVTPRKPEQILQEAEIAVRPVTPADDIAREAVENARTGGSGVVGTLTGLAAAKVSANPNRAAQVLAAAEQAMRNPAAAVVRMESLQKLLAPFGHEYVRLLSIPGGLEVLQHLRKKDPKLDAALAGEGAPIRRR